MCPFEANVFSFAMVYFKILFKRDPFDDCRRDEILERIERDERPKLPSNCDELTKLIKECWNLNPLHRPKFAKNYERLIVLKKELIGGVIAAKIPYFCASKDKSHEGIELQQIYNRLLVPQSILLNEVKIS